MVFIAVLSSRMHYVGTRATRSGIRIGIRIKSGKAVGVRLLLFLLIRLFGWLAWLGTAAFIDW